LLINNSIYFWNLTSKTKKNVHLFGSGFWEIFYGDLIRTHTQSFQKLCKEYLNKFHNLLDIQLYHVSSLNYGYAQHKMGLNISIGINDH
jgi:hypothetical protein